MTPPGAGPTWVILVVDDAPDIHDLVEARLRPEGYELVHALDREGALALLRARTMHLVLLDLDLGGESGLDLCRVIHDLPAHRTIPIIVLTGNAEVDMKVEALDAGAVDYVTKPFDGSELRARVRAALRTAFGAGAPRRASNSTPTLADTGVLGGHYALGEAIGAGGFAEVYRARDLRTGDEVAIKRLRVDLASNEAMVARLRREVQATELSRHPNVVRLLEVGEDALGRPFLVQELLQGETLAARLARGPKLGLDEALALLAPIVDAVGAAHEQRVIHRDLKPENIFLHRPEAGGPITPKVFDFGISRVHAPAGEARLTQTGLFLGTPAYMSPEQITGEQPVEASSDVWSLGVILHEILSGQPLFTGETPWKLFLSALTSRPPPLSGVPEAVAEVVRRCLSRKAEDRYPSAVELGEALRGAMAAALPGSTSTSA